MTKHRAVFRVLALTLATSFASVCLAVGAAPPSQAEEAGAVTALPASVPRYEEYVALGDSWTADVVLLDGRGVPDTRYAPLGCAQSKVNYPKLVEQTIRPATFRDASCGAATTEHFANSQSVLLGTNEPQFARLTATTDLVTVGIGGNDAGIAAAGLDCLGLVPLTPITDIGVGLPLGGCKAKYTRGGVDQLSQQINASEDKLVAAFEGIRERSPNARILAVNYMDVVPDHGCFPRLAASDTDMKYISAKFRELNAMIDRAAARAAVEVVDTFASTGGHDLCTGPFDRYAEAYGLSLNGVAVGVPAHPNSAGAEAQARAVIAHLGG
jgi:lysophospholipase L1-like esterase